jgi:hypothetical protein
MQQLLTHFKKDVDYGIHPSYESHRDTALLNDEIRFLESFTQPVIKSRQHYIKFTLPDTYRTLVAAGINADYSMGFADQNGFRAGTSNTFLWFDLMSNTVTPLQVFPFVFMDATAIFYNKQQPPDAMAELEQLYSIIQKTNSQMITVFHNYTLGEAGMYVGWRTLYKQLLMLVSS